MGRVEKRGLKVEREHPLPVDDSTRASFLELTIVDHANGWKYETMLSSTARGRLHIHVVSRHPIDTEA